MLALVAPVTMTGDQQTMWISSAVDALDDIRANEVQAVSLEVRRAVQRPSQIVPKIAELVAERRKHERWIREHEQPALPGPPIKRHIADRDRRNFTADDWAELNAWLESQGSTVRYGPEGKKLVERAA
jgi:hypothetical protein